MALIKRDKFGERDLERNLERPFRNFMDRFFGSDISDYVGSYRGTVPSVNLKETNQDIQLEIAAPGMKKEDFQVTLENDYLTISGESKQEKEEKEEEYSRKEFNYESFQRSFYLPSDLVNADKIEAKYSDGILRICVPKSDAGKNKESKHIDIS